MWDGLLMLLFLSVIMGVASFLAGSLPLSFALNPRQLRLMTALGTGVLVGTSLIVIIPEGVETLYSAGGSAHSHSRRALAIGAREGLYHSTAEFPAALAHASDISPWEVANIQPQPRQPQDTPEQGFRTGPDDGHDGPASDAGSASDSGSGTKGGKTGDKQGSEEFEPHVWIGVSLILGFILMYLIDTLPQTATTPSRPQRFHINLGNLSFNRPGLSTIPENAETPGEDSFATSSSPSRESRPSSTTVGLVIHAAADGIALGASSTTASSHLSFIIFIAIIIHKAPASFGLTTTLLKQGLSKRMARAHLIIFALAAPVGALLTWAAVHLLGFSSEALGESASAEFATGVLLLFSAGTFLYVAMHTMQENGSDHSHGEEHGMNGFAGVPLDDPYAAPHVPSPPKTQGRTLVDTLVTVGGMLLPLLTQWGHAH